MVAPSALRTVLVVDDNEINRSILHAILESEYRVLEAENGVQALEILTQNYSQISLVLSDYFMPLMDGHELLEAISKNPMFSAIPVVIVTSADSSEEEARCLELGAADFIRKPVDAKIALNRIHSLIRLRETNAALCAIEINPETGLFTHQAFLIHAQEFAKVHADRQLTALLFEICDFDQLEDIYGAIKVSDYLKLVSRFLSLAGDKSVNGYFGDGRFATLSETVEGANPEWLVNTTKDMLAKGPIPDLRPKFGVYENVDPHKSMRDIFRETAYTLATIEHDYIHNVALYDEKRAEEHERRTLLADTFSSSLEAGDLFVVYQPKHNANTGALIGAEALIRWAHPDLGFVSPGEFIPLFESTGQVHLVDNFVRHTVYQDMCHWREQGLTLVPISTNFSKRDLLDHDYITSMTEGRKLDSEALPAELFHAEVTETMWANAPEIIQSHLQKLQDTGYKIELDDFGTGYSSLGMLVDMPIDVVKLDMSLVRNLDTQEPIVRHSIELAHELGKQALAEGVEDIETLERLRALGIDSIQGYYFSKPLTADEFADYLRAHA